MAGEEIIFRNGAVFDGRVFLPQGTCVLAGIDATTPDPADGRIERDAGGKPNGALQEGAADLVSRLLPDISDADWDAALAAAQEYLLSMGITGWQDAIIGSFDGARDNLPVYLCAAEAGRLAVNVTGALWWDREHGLDQLPELLHRRETARTSLTGAVSSFAYIFAPWANQLGGTG